MAMRSERLKLPVLIWPQLVATAMSAIVVSSVSPERCDMHAGPARPVGHLDGLERFGERADLVDLDQDAVGAAPL